MNIFYQKRCNIDIIYFWKEIAKFIPGMVVPAILGLVLNKFIIIDSILSFLVPVVIYTVVYVGSMWFFSMNSYEKNLIRVPVYRILRRGNENDSYKE